MPSFGFIGSSYQVSTADVEETMNLHVETIKPVEGRSQGSAKRLVATPGLAAWADLPTQPVQGEHEASGRGFVVSGWVLYEVFAGATYNQLGYLVAGSTCVFADSPTQLLVSNGTQGYIFQLANGVNFDTSLAEVAGTFSQISDPGWLGGSTVGFGDGYFFATEPNSQVYTLSALNDGLSWSALDFGDVEGAPENVVGMIVHQRMPWFFCSDHGEVYYNSGNANFPYTRLQGAYLDQGLASAETLRKCDNTLFWVGQNKDGEGMVWRANGYTPQRISDYGVELALGAAALLPGGLSGATAYVYQENGHTFYRLDFQKQTWVYDVGEDEWHRRGQYNALTGLFNQHPAQRHMFVFNQHIVGDYQSGNLWTQSMANPTDLGVAIRRVRRAPVVSKEDDFIKFKSLRLLMVLANLVAGATPTITLRSSDDGGKSFRNERTIPLPLIGNGAGIVEWRRLGRARRRVFEVIIEQPFFVSFTNALLEYGK